MIKKNLKANRFSWLTLFTLTYLSLHTPLSAQIFEPDINLLKENLRFLSSDSLKGRAPGTPEDSIAAYFIASKLLENGMLPLIGDSPVIPFTFTIRRELSVGSYFIVDGRTLLPVDDYSISPVSPDLLFEGEVEYVDKEIIDRAISLKESAMPSFEQKSDKKAALIKTSQDSVMFFLTPLSQLGYSAVLFFDGERPQLPLSTQSSGVNVPVLRVSDSIAEHIIDRGGAYCELKSSVTVVRGRSYNVAAISNSKAKRYILTGAHYDHLGYGGPGSGSMSQSKDDIHNGADDNASGVVAALETARLLSSNGYGDSDYGFAVAAFGAEERGLVGSRILADTLEKLSRLPSLMINMDMVGRMNETRLQAGGAGTFKGADSLVNITNNSYKLNMVITQEGYGPSDHASFYTKDVPVLYFTTGVHSEYHTPADDFELINFEGLQLVSAFITTLISSVLESGFYPEHQKTEAPVASRRSFKVTLGVIPDFTYENGDGFRVGSVTDGRAAAKAGVIAGDVITEMGRKKINNIYDYMSALGDLKPGISCEITVRRGGEFIRLVVDF